MSFQSDISSWLSKQGDTKTFLSPSTQAILSARKSHVDRIAGRYLEREFPASGITSNVKLKIVGTNGSTYCVPEPDWPRYYREWDEYSASTATGVYLSAAPILHYTLGPVIQMSRDQRAAQLEQRLPGCVANCHVPPIGSIPPKQRRGQFLKNRFPDADEVMLHFQGG